MKDLILGAVTDLVSNFLYYDRKEDEELPREAIQGAILSEQISVEDIVKQFRIKLLEGLEIEG